MYFTFQQSLIWEAGNPVDPTEEVITVKGKTEYYARKKLRNNDTGRVWVLISSRSRNKST